VVIFRQRTGSEKTAARGEILLKTFRRTVQAAELIAKKLFPGTAQPLKKVTGYREVFCLFDEGDCHYLEEVALCAKDRDIHFVEELIEADPEGDPVEFPDEIDLKVESGTRDKSIQYLITRNEPRSKRVLIFFLPLVKSGGQDPRQYRVTFYWRGLMRRLIVRGEEDFENQVKSVDPVPMVEYEFWVKPKLGRLTCVNIGPELDSRAETLEEIGDEKGMRGWKYQGRNLPGDHTTRLRLRLEKV
jgi:hypothetical protein